ncbi:MAG: Crp/Fnr family transcriptional regulator [Desulfovibrio sp.]
MQIIDYIKKDILFQGLDEEMLKQVAAMGILRSYAKGQMVFHAGDEGNGFYMVAEGQVKIYQDSPSGKEQILHMFGPGNAFGEVAVFQARSFPANAKVLQKGKLIFFSRETFIEGIKADPELAIAMLGLLAMRLRGLVRKVEALSLRDVPSRLAEYLLRLEEEQGGPDIVLSMKKGEIAALLGTIQETLSRVLKKFSESGAISIKGKNITILNKEQLEDYVEGPF